MDIHQITARARKINWINNVYDFLRLRRDSRHSIRVYGTSPSKELFNEIKEAHRVYGWSPNEYFLYHYHDLTEEQRQSFIGDKEMSDIVKQMNEKSAIEILSDKWMTYQFYKSFFQREVIKSAVDDERLVELLRKNGRLIVKPLTGSFGRGIQIINATDNCEETVKQLYLEYPKGFIAEELIEQDERMAILHPESVNTLRVNTISYNGKVIVFHSCIRTGRGKNCVDNVGSGGIGTSCDPMTGEILTAVDEYGHSFINHPDNGVPLVGYKVPCWNEALELSKKLALHIPGLHYAGWDLALTKNGWVLVEGNPRAQLGFQCTEQKGFREEMADILRELNVDVPDVMFKKGRKTY